MRLEKTQIPAQVGKRAQTLSDLTSWTCSKVKGFFIYILTLCLATVYNMGLPKKLLFTVSTVSDL